MWRWFFALFLLGGVARAEAPREEAMEIDNRLNLRIGAASTDANGRPAICLEVTVWGPISAEGCGTGSGFLHHEPGAEVAHFRAKWLLATLEHVGGGRLRLHAGAGFAELQLTADEPGFVFGRPRAADPIEVAGPEASVGAQLLAPLGEGFEAVFNLSAGLAWFPHAGALVVPQDEWQPFVGFELGVGW